MTIDVLITNADDDANNVDTIAVNNTNATNSIDVAYSGDIAIIIVNGIVAVACNNIDDAVARNNNATISIDVARNDKTAIIIVDSIVAVDVT